MVKSVSSDSIFSLALASKTNPTFCGIWTSEVAVKFSLALEAIVKSVPSPSIFSPSFPNVIPMLAGTLTSPVASKVKSPPVSIVNAPLASISAASNVIVSTVSLGASKNTLEDIAVPACLYLKNATLPLTPQSIPPLCISADVAEPLPTVIVWSATCRLPTCASSLLPVTVKSPGIVTLPLLRVTVSITVFPPEDSVRTPLEAIVISVPSPSIFSPSSPNVRPTSDGMLISVVAVKFMSAPELSVKSVSFDSIFSEPLSSNTIPLFLGMWTSEPAAKLIFAPLIVRSVPSPSIFSPSSPKVRPMSAGIFISPLAPTVIFKSVSSDSIFSCVPNITPTLTGTLISAVPVRLILLPAIVRSVPSPSIFSPSLPNVNPTLAGMLISVVAVRLISCPDAIVISVPSPEKYSPPASNK